MAKLEAVQGLNRVAADQEVPGDVVREITNAIKGIRYGSVEVIVHDGRVVQIERKEKVRFDQTASARSG